MSQTILVVEDHPLYRAALLHMLQGILGERGAVAASCAEDGLRLVDTHPDLSVILLDLNLPGIHGMEAITMFQRKCPLIPIVVVSASEDRQEATLALRAGASAFVSKAASSAVLSDVVRRLLSGALTTPEWITASGKMTIGGVDSLNLSVRQQETLVLLLRGHSNKEIGLHLGLAEITVKVHVSSLFRALGVVNRTQAVLAARRLGLGSDYQE